MAADFGIKQAAAFLDVSRATITRMRGRELPDRSRFTQAELEAARDARAGRKRAPGPLRGAAARNAERARGSAAAPTAADSSTEQQPAAERAPDPKQPAADPTQLNLPCAAAPRSNAQQDAAKPPTPPAAPQPPDPPHGNGAAGGDFFDWGT